MFGGPDPPVPADGSAVEPPHSTTNTITDQPVTRERQVEPETPTDPDAYHHPMSIQFRVRDGSREEPAQGTPAIAATCSHSEESTGSNDAAMPLPEPAATALKRRIVAPSRSLDGKPRPSTEKSAYYACGLPYYDPNGRYSQDQESLAVKEAESPEPSEHAEEPADFLVPMAHSSSAAPTESLYATTASSAEAPTARRRFRVLLRRVARGAVAVVAVAASVAIASALGDAAVRSPADHEDRSGSTARRSAPPPPLRPPSDKIRPDQGSNASSTVQGNDRSLRAPGVRRDGEQIAFMEDRDSIAVMAAGQLLQGKTVEQVAEVHSRVASAEQALALAASSMIVNRCGGYQGAGPGYGRRS